MYTQDNKYRLDNADRRDSCPTGKHVEVAT